MTLRAKFCVVGTGAGGGMLAYRLAAAGEDVVVVNSGSVPAQSEFKNELSPEQQGHFGIRAETRFPATPEISLIHPLFSSDADKSSISLTERAFQHYQIHHVNGLQNLWNGICLRYAQDDFANRKSYNRECEWPITYDDLAPHYSEVERLANVVGSCDGLPQIPDGTFLPPRLPRKRDRVFLESNAKLFGPDLFYFPSRKAVDLRADSPQKCVACGHCSRGCRSGSMYKFSTHLLPRIAARQNFRLIDHARVVKIVPSNFGDGAGRYAISEVVAIDERNNQAIRIRADVVILCAGAIESPRIMLNSFADDLGKTEQVGLFLQDSPRVIVSSSLFRLWFKPVTEDCGYGDHVLFGGRCGGRGDSVPFVAHIWSDYIKLPHYLPDLRFTPHFLRETVARQIYKSAMVLIMQGPAVPRRENRVVLNERMDRFSQRLVEIRYAMDEKEIEHNRRFEVLAKRMLRNASGYITVPVPSTPGMGIHYVGTCRMSGRSERGVVDKDLKVFGATNLYVCDGGVIPTLSEAHSTLTIMALAYRLGQHLIEKYC